MKSYLKIKIILLFQIIICSCNTNELDESKSIKIDVKNKSKSVEKDFNEVIKEFSFLTLKNIPVEDAVYSFDKVIEYDNNFFVLDKKKSNVLVFNEKGEYKRKIGNRGEGPGEYESIFDFDINKENGEVLLLDNQVELLFYSSENKFIKSLRFEEFFPESISLLNSNELACSLGHIEPGGNAINIISTKDGSIIKGLAKYPKEYNDYKSYSFTGGIVSTNNRIFYTYKSSSLIYEISRESKLTPLYQFNLGPKTWPENQIFNLNEFDSESHRFNISLLTNNYCLSNNVLAFEYLDVRKIKHGYYFLKEDKVYSPQDKLNSKCFRFFSIPLGLSNEEKFIGGMLYENFQVYNKDEGFLNRLRLIDEEFVRSLKNLNYNNSSMLIFYKVHL